MPVQIYWFYHKKKKKKKKWNFWAEIRKIVSSPVNPSFTISKWRLRGSTLYRHVFVTSDSICSIAQQYSADQYGRRSSAYVRWYYFGATLDPRYEEKHYESVHVTSALLFGVDLTTLPSTGSHVNSFRFHQRVLLHKKQCRTLFTAVH